MMDLNNDSVEIVIFVITIIAIIFNSVSIVLKLCKEFTNPKLWKCSLLHQDIAFIFLCIGLVFFCVCLIVDVKRLCDVTGFFLIFGIFQCLLSYLTTGIILLSIQNPGKSTSISGFHRNLCIAILLPEVAIGTTLSFLPYVSSSIFNTDVEFDVLCFPIRDHGKQGATYGTLLVALWWVILVAVVICDVILVLKLWKFNNRINSAQNNVWQTQLLIQGKALVKFSIFEHCLYLIVIIIITLSVYIDSSFFKNNNTWIIMTSLALSAILHGILSNIGDVMWTTCCCRDNRAVKEPHRKLKKLELLKIEAPGKLRMKATWTVGKHATKRGLMKVYGINHLKNWAQEIVMLGMLRRIQHPSLIQCLWTNSSNPYYETMTLISGEIITSDSRIICLELTNGGTLNDFLHKVELPLPEQCQRMIIHDIAEGLFYLHHENILHSNLTTSCIYLKGSLQTQIHKKKVKSMVLRAAVGDFEEAQIYGTLQQNLDSSIKDKRYFFLPDIRSFALIALEVVAKMCEKKFQNRYVNYSAEHVPLKLNLANVISDEDDEFESQYCYEVEDTHRMFHAIHDDDEVYPTECDSDDNFEVRKEANGSLSNLMDQSRPMSPMYNARDSKTPDTLYNSSSEHENDVKEKSNSNLSKTVSFSQNGYKKSRDLKVDQRNKADVVNSDAGKASSRKSRKDRKDSSKQSSRSFDQFHSNSSSARSMSPNYSDERQGNRSCPSPDPMKDEMIQELRKETTSGVKSSKKDRKFSLNRKRSEEDVLHKAKIEAFVKTGAEQTNKRKDGNWLAKPSSILKSITGNDTTVSVFKAKPNDEETHLDAIEEEDIHPGQSLNSKTRQVKVKEAKQNKAEVWDIIDEQYYTQVNRKAMNNLKKTISGESRSSLWSFISTPEDLDDEDLDDILECLPGMTEPFEFQKPEISVNEILTERENAVKREQTKKRFDLTDLSKSKFELIDYYEMLKSKQITINDVPEDKREMLLNVVELKLEEKMRREGKSVGSVIRSDEMYDNNMNPRSENNNQKVKLVSFRKGQCNSSPHRNPNPPSQERDPRLDRARSAPLKRPRTPMHKPPQERPPEINPAFQETKSVTTAKRNKARAALRKAINNKGMQNYGRVIAERNGQWEQMPVKYATVRKINADSSANNESENTNSTEVLTVPVPTSESFSVMTVKPKLNDVKRYPSFSSNESASSIGSSVRQRPADVSLTSGELSSLSSQAESDHYETDFHMTDAEMSNKVNSGRTKLKGPSSRVDSGFDSGSMSSEMSDAFNNRNVHLNQHFLDGSNKGIVSSWARNYKMVDSLPDSPYKFAHKFLPPVDSLPEENLTDNRHQSREIKTDNVKNDKPIDKDSDSGMSASIQSSASKTSTGSERNSRSRKRANPRKKTDLKAFDFTPYTTFSSRPAVQNHRAMSPTNRVMSPVGRTITSPNRSTQPNISRPFSPQLYESSDQSSMVATSLSHVSLSYNNQSSFSQDRPMSPYNRPMSPNERPMSPSNRPSSPRSRPMFPLSRPMSPNVQPTNNRIAKLKVSHPRSASPSARTFSQTPIAHQSKPDSRPFSPGRKLARPPSSQQVHVEETDETDEVDADVPNLSDTASIAESSASKASKRYRALVKQGVPLRTSVIDASPTRTPDGMLSRPGTAESMLEEPPDDQNLFENLNANGFFRTRPRSRSPSPHKGLSPARGPSPVNSNTKEHKDTRRRKKHIPLDEIIRETPTSSSRGKPHRSASKNHLTVSEDMFLNQPTSEDSETCSVKTTKSNTSTPSRTVPKVMVDAEMVIDRIFSQQQAEDNELDVEVEAALGLDKDPFKAINEMYLSKEQPETSNLNDIPLLNGVNQHHIHGCLELVSSMHVVTVRDLLPAKHDNFEVLRKKLQQVGQLGNVGNQLLDVIHKCWLQDMPPTSGDLVEQLTDPVTETEL